MIFNITNNNKKKIIAKKILRISSASHRLMSVLYLLYDARVYYNLIIGHICVLPLSLLDLFGKNIILLNDF